MSLTLRGIKGSALTHGELDNNFLWLKSRDIVDATLAGTNLVLTKDDTTTFNVDLSSISGGANGGNMWHVPYGYTLTVQDNFQSFIYGDLYIEGTIDLQTNAQLVVLNGDIHISGGTIVGSGTTQVVELPDFDTKISGLTYTADTLTIYQNDGTTYSTTIVSSTDVKVSDLSYTGDTLTLTQTDGSYFNVIINSSTPFTGNTSGDCITDLYVTNLNSCSQLHIQPINTGDVYISEGGGNVGVGTSSPNAKLSIVGSGSSMSSPLFNVQGSSGQLFSVSDSLIGSLFSVNDISGLPVIEAFSDNTILMGDFNSPSLNTTKKVVVNSGVTPIYSIPSSGYTGAFYDYTVLSSLGARSGNIMSIWSGTSIQYSETSTTSIGNTSGIIFSVSLSGNSTVLSTSANTNSWTVKTIVRSI